MCIVNPKTITDANEMSGVGFKVFAKRGNELVSLFTETKALRKNKWLHEKDFRNEYGKVLKCLGNPPNSAYPLGFHIYLNLRKGDRLNLALLNLVIYKVKYRKAHTTGKGADPGQNIAVALEILITNEKVELQKTKYQYKTKTVF